MQENHSDSRSDLPDTHGAGTDLPELHAEDAYTADDYMLEEDDLPARRDAGEALRYVQKRAEEKRRRKRQVRMLWFILAVTVGLSVFTIVYVGSRLAAMETAGQGAPGKETPPAAGDISEDISETDSAAVSSVSTFSGTDSGVSPASGSEAEPEEPAAVTPSEVIGRKELAAETEETEQKAAADEKEAAADGDAQDEGRDMTAEKRPAPTPELHPYEEDEVWLVAAGDNLIHQRLYEQAAARAGGDSYDFSYAYEMAASFIAQHDIAWIDVETLINNRLEPSGYPEFSTPGESGDALIAAGFNVFSLASNHTYDFGAEGLSATLDYWSENLPEGAVTAGLWREASDTEETVGEAEEAGEPSDTAENAESVAAESETAAGESEAAESETAAGGSEAAESGTAAEGSEAAESETAAEGSETAESETAAEGLETAESETAEEPENTEEAGDAAIPVLTTEKGYRIAFLTYVDFTNAAPEEEMPAHVIYLSEEDRIREQIRMAREQADAVVVSCHWGKEGSHEITDEQVLISQKMADWGADLIIGDHTHVIQNGMWITAADGRKVFCVYSLGNFVSTQELPDELIGQLLDVTLKFTDGPEGRTVEVHSPRLIPIVTVYGKDGADAHVVLYRDLLEEEILTHGIRDVYPEFDRSYIEKIIRTHVNSQFLREPLTEIRVTPEPEPDGNAAADEEDKAQEKTEEKMEEKTEEKTDDKTEKKTEEKAEEKTEEKTEERAEEKTKEKTEDKAGEKTEEKVKKSSAEKQDAEEKADSADSEAGSSAESKTGSSAESKTDSSAESKTDSGEEAGKQETA